MLALALVIFVAVWIKKYMFRLTISNKDEKIPDFNISRYWSMLNFVRDSFTHFVIKQGQATLFMNVSHGPLLESRGPNVGQKCLFEG